MQSLRRKQWQGGLIAIALALPLLAGCGGGGGGGSSSGGGGGGVTVTPVTKSATTTHGKATLTADRGTVALNGTVSFTLTLTNTTAATEIIHTTSATAPPMILLITNPSGTLIYNPPPAPPLTDVALAPGKSLTVTLPISVFTSKGVYKATASVSFSDGTVATPVGPISITVQ